MEKPKSQNCQKCNASFICNAGDITNCQCSAVSLDPKTTLFLTKTYFGCLCRDCLIKLDFEVKASEAYQFPKDPKLLTEGLHYYKENGNWVFTELYHMLRGSCCGNGCRHCVYGYRYKADYSKNRV